jgi:hypothetical protein
MKKITISAFSITLLGIMLGCNNSTNLSALLPTATPPYSVGLLSEQASLLACPTGGWTNTFYKDLNNNGQMDLGEGVLAVESLCNGLNGTSASIGMSTASAAACPTGGYVITSSTSPTTATICNGANGLNGSNGLNGLNGTDGTVVTPVKFCNGDNSAFPEYGLMVGSQLFGVYWGATPASNGVSQAFLALLTPGSYVSTGGNGCSFTLN